MYPCPLKLSQYNKRYQAVRNLLYFENTILNEVHPQYRYANKSGKNYKSFFCHRFQLFPWILRFLPCLLQSHVGQISLHRWRKLYQSVPDQKVPLYRRNLYIEWTIFVQTFIFYISSIFFSIFLTIWSSTWSIEMILLSWNSAEAVYTI